MSRMWQNFAYDIDWKVQVFQERATAIEWLVHAVVQWGGECDALDEYPSLKTNSIDRSGLLVTEA